MFCLNCFCLPVKFDEFKDDTWVDSGNNLWLGQRSSSCSFQEIVKIMAIQRCWHGSKPLNLCWQVVMLASASKHPKMVTASCAKKLKSLSGYGCCIMISFRLSPGATSFWPGRYWPSGRRWDCAGRWAIIDKQFDDGGYPWVLTGDKATKSSLKQELSNMPGSVFNFGRESEAYVPTKPSSTHQKTRHAFDHKGKVYTG